MKKSVFPKICILTFLLTAFIITSCSKDDTPTTTKTSNSVLPGGNSTTKDKDPIVGKWDLKVINDTDVSKIKCYKDSYIHSDAKTITFYLLELNEDETCEEMLSTKETLTINDGFYYMGDTALDFSIEKNILTWRPSTELTLIYQK